MGLAGVRAAPLAAAISDIVYAVSEEQEPMGARLRRARDAAGLGRPELEKLSGINRKNIQNWEEGLKATPLFRQNVKLLAEILEVDPEWLRHGDQPKESAGDAVLADEVRAVRAEVARLERKLDRLLGGDGDA